MSRVLSFLVRQVGFQRAAVAAFAAAAALHDGHHADDDDNDDDDDDDDEVDFDADFEMDVDPADFPDMENPNVEIHVALDELVRPASCEMHTPFLLFAPRVCILSRRRVCV